MAANQIPNSVGEVRYDGYVNMMNKYGTSQDNSTAYEFMREGVVPDMLLTEQYESDGLFAKIIDTPAEEAVKHGFDLGLKSAEADAYIADMLDVLDFEERASQGIKWARLYGGALGVMLIDDGRGIDEPLNWKNIRSIDEIRVYERALVYPDYGSMYNYDPRDPTKSSTSKFGMPEYYQVNSIYGQFWVHESRCLIFRNGNIPERTTYPVYRYWGVPELVRIKRELRETVTAHGNGAKLLDRSVQPIYKMLGLANLLDTEGGEEKVLKRLRAIDMARGILNSIAIDAEGEDYDFKEIAFSGAKDVVDTTCNLLSAVTNIPQTILFGRSPAGQNSTGQSDLENYYNFVERIQKLMLRGNLRTLIDIIVRAGLRQGKIEEEPDIKLTFNKLWSISEAEQMTIDLQKAQLQQIKAQTSQVYVDMGALDPSEVRRGLAKEEDFEVEDLLDDVDVDDDMWNGGAGGIEGATGGDNVAGGGDNIAGGASEGQADISKLYSEIKERFEERQDSTDLGSVGVIVLHPKDENKVLAGYRSGGGAICGPGGHIEIGETPAQAAIRETQEEFSITPLNLTPLGQIEGLENCYGKPFIYLCTEYEGLAGIPLCNSKEMSDAFWIDPVDNEENLFPPFAESLKMLGDKELFSKTHSSNTLKSGIMQEDDDKPRDENGKFVDIPGSKVENGKTVDLNIKPTVANPQLQGIIDGIYKAQGKKGQIGNGTIMDAVRNELKTGKKTKRRLHSKKAKITKGKLKNLISGGKLTKQEKNIARALIDDISKALNGS